MNKERRKNQQRFVMFMGILLSFAMGASLLLPLLSNAANTTQVTQPTQTPAPTVPAPIEDLSSISFEDGYLHPSGVFTAAIPEGYVPVNEFSTTGEAQVTMRNNEQLSVVELRVLRPTQGIDLSTADGISEFFDSGWLGASWREYTSWDEAQRRTEDGRVIIDFNLSRTGQNYIARQIAFSDGTWIYSGRVVTPSNASSYLRYILENEIESFNVLEPYVGEPLQWNAYFDDGNNYMIRYPSEWQVVDTAPGAPTSITGENAQLLVETILADINSTDAATEYVENLGAGTNVLSVEEVEQGGLSGYRVAYARTTLDGATESGIVQLLPDQELVYSQNLLLPSVSDQDLNALSEEDANYNTVSLLDSFLLLPDLNLE